MRSRYAINTIWISMMFSAVVPMALGFGLSRTYPDWHLSHYPLHAMVESVGSLSAVTIATLVIIMVRNQHLAPRFIIVAAALIGMGLLDGFHSVLHAGVSFVWLHSIATLIGGLVFSAVWLPESWLTPRRQIPLIVIVSVSAVLVGFISLLFPATLPAMIANGGFSLVAKILNIGGGLGFLVGTCFFVHTYRHPAVGTRPDHSSKLENVVFANHCLLFGIAGLLFETSELWDVGWWWWHLLRLAAYAVALIYFFVLFNRSQIQLRANQMSLEQANQNLEFRVQQRTHDLEQANQAKLDFLSAMSHELRTPMNAIMGFAQLLQLDKAGFDQRQKEHIAEIVIAGNHLLHLIDEVLDLSRIESGKMTIDMQNVHVDQVLKQCVNMIAPQAAAKDITVKDNLCGEQHMVMADEHRLKQVLLNLLSNAVKYNRDHGTIIMDCTPMKDNHLRISITDSGKGLTEDQMARLFLPFERLDAPSDVPGTGIGLTISQSLVEMMNGTIGAHSTPGGGSTFWIELVHSQ